MRRALFEQTGGMFPELVTRSHLEVFLPPIVGDLAAIADSNKAVAVRFHDESKGSDMFVSDICTYRLYLVHGIEVCVQTAQECSVGIIVCCRKVRRS